MHLRLFREQPASQPFPCPFINTPLPHLPPLPTDRRYRQRKPQHQSKCTAPSGGAIEPGPFQISPFARSPIALCHYCRKNHPGTDPGLASRLSRKLWPHYNNSNNSSDAFPSSARVDPCGRMIGERYYLCGPRRECLFPVALLLRPTQCRSAGWRIFTTFQPTGPTNGCRLFSL